jgi:hypothetical protein
MATFTKTNGTTQPVFALDVANGTIAGTANAAAQGSVQMAGPKLDFYTLIANTALTTTTGAVGNVNGFINQTMQGIQSVSTVAIYQVSPLSSSNSLAVAIYPSGSYANATTFLTAANTAFTGYQWSSAYANAQFYTGAIAV